jgi:hypothetical protein
MDLVKLLFSLYFDKKFTPYSINKQEKVNSNEKEK